MMTGFANTVNPPTAWTTRRRLGAGGGLLTVIAFWRFITPPTTRLTRGLVISADVRALLGFLWWNAHPAKIIMGDVGSQGIGSLLAALAILTNTHLSSS